MHFFLQQLILFLYQFEHQIRVPRYKLGENFSFNRKYNDMTYADCCYIVLIRDQHFICSYDSSARQNFNSHLSASIQLGIQINLTVLNDGHAFLVVTWVKQYRSRLQIVLFHSQYYIEDRFIFSMGEIGDISEGLAKKNNQLVIIGLNTIYDCLSDKIIISTECMQSLQPYFAESTVVGASHCSRSY